MALIGLKDLRPQFFFFFNEIRADEEGTFVEHTLIEMAAGCVDLL